MSLKERASTLLIGPMTSELGTRDGGTMNYNFTKPDNSYLQNDNLFIVAREISNGQYTSARLKSQGLQNFTYGRIDVRAILPIGQGIWPAIWMLGVNFNSLGWPACGEIDIMEHCRGQIREGFMAPHIGAQTTPFINMMAMVSHFLFQRHLQMSIMYSQ